MDVTNEMPYEMVKLSIMIYVLLIYYLLANKISHPHQNLMIFVSEVCADSRDINY
jgi:hypothetical protein